MPYTTLSFRAHPCSFGAAECRRRADATRRHGADGWRSATACRRREEGRRRRGSSQDSGTVPTTPALPAPKGRRKRWKLFEIEGYFRVRTEWFKNFNLGFLDDPASRRRTVPARARLQLAPTRRAVRQLAERSNIRLRLEPTMNLDEGTSVHIQADVLDNLVLGSTPTNTALNGVYTDTNHPPIGAFGSRSRRRPPASTATRTQSSSSARGPKWPFRSVS